MMRACLSALLGVLVVVAAARAEPPPWQRTEARQPCASFEPLRRPLFGELHVHTAISADAYIYGTRLRPRDAYAFAKGAPVVIPDTMEAQVRTATIDRPLDFTAVTDHAEFFGGVEICTTPGSVGYDHPLCDVLRRAETAQSQRFLAQISWQALVGVPPPPQPLPVCAVSGADCDAATISAWGEVQAAAEEAYDRTAACTFTSLIGFEYTRSPAGRHLHRNVIFRNEHVPLFPLGYDRTFAGGVPQGLWSAVESECLDAGTGCDAVIIPHNSNLSGGEQWLDPADGAEALRRQTLEPLAEIHQQKGNSECRFDQLVGAGTDTADELCTFEQDPAPHQLPGTPPPPVDQYPRRNMIRNTLKDGLALEEQLGANPFRLGFVGGTDSHNATAGNTEESTWEGGEGGNDASPETKIRDQIRTNPGGLTAVWAEENSRDAIFAALRRRETYATSGTRMQVRFFAGDYRAGANCNAPDLVRRAYERGTPMGGELGAVRQRKSPDFLVWAAKDPGTVERPGTDLARLQVVKGWVDAAGAVHERVFDVAQAGAGAGVDPVTCAPVGTGASELCARWKDPDFDPRQRAFYYARVLENPTCRWSTTVCKEAGVDPFAADCAAQAAAAGTAFANCCLGPANDPFLAPTVQERAWTSPIWYRPDTIRKVGGGIRFGRRPGTDRLDVAIRFWRAPAIDPAANDLEVTLTDDDQIYHVTIPAGTLVQRGPGRWIYRDRRGALGGLRTIRYAITRGGEAKLRLRSVDLDLAHADRSDHSTTLRIASGLFRAEHTRRWQLSGRRLRPKG
jgi:hypothetical protein